MLKRYVITSGPNHYTFAACLRIGVFVRVSYFRGRLS